MIEHETPLWVDILVAAAIVVPIAVLFLSLFFIGINH